MPTFVAQYTYKTTDTSADGRDGLRDQHLAYLSDLQTKGILLVAGPWGAEDPAGGLTVISADDHETAHEVISRDPYVKAGIPAKVSIVQWRAVLGPVAVHLPA